MHAPPSEWFPVGRTLLLGAMFMGMGMTLPIFNHFVPRQGVGGLHAREFVNSGSAVGIISVFALVFQHAPLPTSLKG